MSSLPLSPNLRRPETSLPTLLVCERSVGRRKAGVDGVVHESSTSSTPRLMTRRSCGVGPIGLRGGLKDEEDQE